MAAESEGVFEWAVRSVNGDPLTLILLAWSCGETSASMAIVDRADSSGLDMRCLNSYGAAKHHRVSFEHECTSKAQVSRQILDMRERGARPRLAFGFLTVFVGLMWSFLAFAWCHLHGVHVLEERIARAVGMHAEDVPPSKQFMRLATAAIVCANAVEAAAVARIAFKLQFSRRNVIGWAFLTLFAGYPAAHKMLDLKKAVTRATRGGLRKMKGH
ncbi:hypothetical protein M885DRAFT_505186 [Pelagophyceae sp. CCMP2097]|nr:hypothetical protein M885DRAFT_505186 [Pelagophyceae sp. CCMP2097]